MHIPFSILVALVMASLHPSSTTTTVALTQPPQPKPQHFLGIDLGTSGARLSILQPPETEVYSHAISWDGAYDDPSAWTAAVDTLLTTAAASPLQHVRAMCVSGTSASCLMVIQDDTDSEDATTAWTATRAPRMYDYAVTQQRALEWMEQHVPERHTARSPTGSLAKLLAWHMEGDTTTSERLCHQADFVLRHFLDPAVVPGVVSDWHNCLKLGYDVQTLQWPTWMDGLLTAAGLGTGTSVLPSIVVSPGEPIGPIRPSLAQRYGLSPDVVLVGGTTDSNAAFLAATGGRAATGTAVTSLGSTLALKQLSDEYVEDASKGVYSHRFPAAFGAKGWLVGGASNVGCAVLRAENFSNEELRQLSKDIDPSTESPLSYYPLTKKGERFPVSDSEKEPVLEPMPESRKEYLHGILQGISDVERDGFLALQALGASPPVQIWTCGGGSENNMWSRMRERRLRAQFSDTVTVARAQNVEASYGAAILAAATFEPLEKDD